VGEHLRPQTMKEWARHGVFDVRGSLFGLG